MVLKKVGEYVSDILVNGDEIDSFNQDSDTEYDVKVDATASGTQGEPVTTRFPVSGRQVSSFADGDVFTGGFSISEGDSSQSLVREGGDPEQYETRAVAVGTLAESGGANTLEIDASWQDGGSDSTSGEIDSTTSETVVTTEFNSGLLDDFGFSDPDNEIPMDVVFCVDVRVVTEVSCEASLDVRGVTRTEL